MRNKNLQYIQEPNNTMMKVSSSLSEITLNVDGLNSPFKRQKLQNG